MQGHYIYSVKHRAVGFLVSLAAVLVLVSGCGASTDAELNSAVKQLDQDLQQSVGQLNQGIADSLSELKTAVSSAAQAPGTGATTWEYNLGTVAYDQECAAKAIEPYKSDAGVKEALSMGSPSGRYAIGALHMMNEIGAGGYDSSLKPEVWYAISDAYVQCGQSSFQAYSTGMGDQGWEMVSYSPLEYTSPASQYISGLIIGYGYEVMWKRPKASQ
jgi:hypothetical protein